MGSLSAKSHSSECSWPLPGWTHLATIWASPWHPPRDLRPHIEMAWSGYPQNTPKMVILMGKMMINWATNHEILELPDFQTNPNEVCCTTSSNKCSRWLPGLAQWGFFRWSVATEPQHEVWVAATFRRQMCFLQAPLRVDRCAWIKNYTQWGNRKALLGFDL